MIYYIVVIIISYILKIYNLKQLNQTQIRIKNITQLLKYKIRLKRNKIIKNVVILSTVIIIFSILPKELRIYFIDVGQGDSTLIRIPQNKTILIDGGGSANSEFDVGEKTLLPYLLDRGITKLDYIMISHFDQDHVGGLLTVMQEIKVKNAIIGKQYESCENYEKFVKIVKEKKINVEVVEAGQRINIEKNLYFDILWPSSENMISDNAINNNSLVCKLTYKNFSILFTGDIEELAEEKILEEVNNNLLKSDVLKVAHHGSNTSSTQEFIEKVDPKIALIGVGENNKFGHPNGDVLNRFNELRYEDI